MTEQIFNTLKSITNRYDNYNELSNTDKFAFNEWIENVLVQREHFPQDEIACENADYFNKYINI